MLGFDACGWDPVYYLARPSRQYRLRRQRHRKRQETLRRAWGLAEQILVVSARLMPEVKVLRENTDYEDGWRISCGTFQKFFEQQELRQWIDRPLPASTVPGVRLFYAFRDEQARTQFELFRVYRIAICPVIRQRKRAARAAAPSCRSSCANTEGRSR